MELNVHTFKVFHAEVTQLVLKALHLFLLSAIPSSVNLMVYALLVEIVYVGKKKLHQ